MKNENNAFISFENTTAGIIFDDSENKDYPIRYFNVISGSGITTEEENSYFGFVYDGEISIKNDKNEVLKLKSGMFFSFTGVRKFANLIGKAIVIETINTKGIYAKESFSAYPIFGGPLEDKGRLKYIDGCTDSLLIAPVKKGNPCLNHLHFPKDINQTQHTHPSHRIGIVASGYGECITPFGNLPLTQGMIFVIKEWDGKTYGTGLDGKEYPCGTHAFKTESSFMNVVAFHPDSDFGATDEIHPMINRTIVDGVPANQIDEIRTK